MGSKLSEDTLQKLLERLDQQETFTESDLERICSEVPTHKKLHDLFKSLDTNKDGIINREEFRAFVEDRVSYLRSVFDSIDTNHDGRLDTHEIKASVQKAYNVNISDKSAQRMMSVIDKNNDGQLSFTEWRDYLLLMPIHAGSKKSTKHIFDHMKDEATVDFGDIIAISNNHTHWGNLIAGGVAGAVSRTATAPLDRLKTLIQLQTKESTLGIFGGLSKMYSDGGIIAFFRGNFANCLKIAPESATKFFAYEQIKQYISNTRGKELTAVDKFFAGALAGVISQALVYPLDSMKVRMAGSAVKLSIAYANGGLRAFYRGIPANIIGVIPYAGIDLAVYETLKKSYTEYHIAKGAPSQSQTQTTPVFVPLVCGAISSTVAQFASYPLALIRTRLQAQGLPNSEKYTGMIDVLTKTVKREGFFGLYKGMTPNLMKVVPAVGISYVVYEKVKSKTANL